MLECLRFSMLNSTVKYIDHGFGTNSMSKSDIALLRKEVEKTVKEFKIYQKKTDKTINEFTKWHNSVPKLIY